MIQTERKAKPITPLSFDQPAEFYVRRAHRRRDAGSLPEALQDLRTALGKNPDDPETVTEIGEILSLLGRFDQSNEWLLTHLTDERMHEAEVYFLLGRNFMYLDEWEWARECLNLTLNREPDEDTEYEAMSMLDALEDELAYEEEEEEFREDAPELHLVGEPRDLSPEELFTQAAFHAQQGDIAEALHLLDLRSREYGEDMQGLCARGVFCVRAGMKEEGEKTLLHAASLFPDSPRDLTLLADSLGMMGWHDKVLAIMDDLTRDEGENNVWMHLTAMACYNTGNYSRAKRIWSRLCMIDPDDEVMAWYRETAGKALAGQVDYETLPYMIAIPKKEIYLRAQKIGDKLDRETPDEIRNDPELLSAIRWLLDVEDGQSRVPLIGAYCMIEGVKAEPLLRRLLVRRTVAEQEKRYIVDYMHQLGIREPYVALLQAGVVEVRQNEIEYELSQSQWEVLNLVLEQMPADEAIRYRVSAAWTELCSRCEQLTRIRQPRAWAAALLYLLSQDGLLGDGMTQKKAGELFGVSAASVSSHAISLQEMVTRQQEE